MSGRSVRRGIRFVPHASVLAIVAAALFCGGCGEEQVGLFSPDQARTQTLRFQEFWRSGDLRGLVEICTTPFRFETRVWKEPAELEKKLKIQLPRHQAKVSSGDQLEILSYRDLIDGKWPRGKTVPEDERVGRATELGVRRDGFLVRVYSGPGRGWLLILNSHDGVELRVQGVRL